MTKTIKKENLSFLEAIDEGIENAADQLDDDAPQLLPGFCLAKGIQPVTPLLLNGLMLGTPEQRELSAHLINSVNKALQDPKIVILFSFFSFILKSKGKFYNNQLLILDVILYLIFNYL